MRSLFDCSVGYLSSVCLWKPVVVVVFVLFLVTFFVLIALFIRISSCAGRSLPCLVLGALRNQSPANIIAYLSRAIMATHKIVTIDRSIHPYSQSSALEMFRKYKQYHRCYHLLEATTVGKGRVSSMVCARLQVRMFRP
jgi:hypothetical protein